MTLGQSVSICIIVSMNVTFCKSVVVTLSIFQSVWKIIANVNADIPMSLAQSVLAVLLLI